MTTEAPFEWTPHTILEIDCFTKERTGYIGRAVAVRQNGVEFIVLAKNEEQLNLVTLNFMGFEIDPSTIYKATAIASEGIEVKLAPAAIEVPEGALTEAPADVAGPVGDEGGTPTETVPVDTTPKPYVDDEDEL